MIRFPLTSLGYALLATSLVACTSLGSLTSGDKVDYRSARVKATPLEVPPDLTQLAVDPRYAPQAGVVSAAALESSPTAPTAPGVTTTGNAVAPSQYGDTRLERQGNTRYITTSQTPEQVWPQLQAFWEERGLALTLDEPKLGVMETDWAENRAKLPNDFIRNTIGRVFDRLYSTGELDKYRTRVERTESGTDIFISHRGLEEIYANQLKDATEWRPRPNDPLLEGEMLSRLLVKLGAPVESAKTAAQQTAASLPPEAARARLLADRPAATLQLDEGFDRAWRRVGLALDRSGFTVEDRDRAQGLYFVRYVDPAVAGKQEPGFFARLFGKDSSQFQPVRYRVNVKPEGDHSIVAVLNTQGGPENGDAGQRIVKMLLDDLK